MSNLVTLTFTNFQEGVQLDFLALHTFPPTLSTNWNAYHFDLSLKGQGEKDTIPSVRYSLSLPGRIDLSLSFATELTLYLY